MKRISVINKNNGHNVRINIHGPSDASDIEEALKKCGATILRCKILTIGLRRLASLDLEMLGFLLALREHVTGRATIELFSCEPKVKLTLLVAGFTRYFEINDNDSRQTIWHQKSQSIPSYAL